MLLSSVILTFIAIVLPAAPAAATSFIPPNSTDAPLRTTLLYAVLSIKVILGSSV